MRQDLAPRHCPLQQVRGTGAGAGDGAGAVPYDKI
jgi:hypothetical protein